MVKSTAPSYALGFGVVAVIVASAAMILLYAKLPVTDGFDTAVLFLAVAASAGLLLFVYQRIKRNNDAMTELVDQRTSVIRVTDCPDYYTANGTTCENKFNNKVIGPNGVKDEFDLSTVNGQSTRADQCSEANFQYTHGGTSHPRVWTELKNLCS